MSNKKPQLAFVHYVKAKLAKGKARESDYGKKGWRWNAEERNGMILINFACGKESAVDVNARISSKKMTGTFSLLCANEGIKIQSSITQTVGGKGGDLLAEFLHEAKNNGPLYVARQLECLSRG